MDWAFLTKSELIELTGYRQPSKQRVGYGIFHFFAHHAE